MAEQDLAALVEAHRKEECPEPAHVDDGSATVTIHVGLAGSLVEVRVRPEMCMEQLEEAVLQVAGLPASSIAKFSASGARLERAMEVLESHHRGEDIFATFCQDVGDLSLDEVVKELTMADAEFRALAISLQRLTAPHTARNVADQLWQNQALLTADQAQRLFDALKERMRNGPTTLHLKSELIFALHSFCLEPYTVWEPDDGSGECSWANMSYGRQHLEFPRHPVTRGIRTTAPDAAAVAAAGREDVSNLRGVLRAFREDAELPLEAMVPLAVYHYTSWRLL